MSLNSFHLDAVYACAQTGHFTKAAKRLHITQSALSQRIQNLESELGTALFIREKKGIRLTEIGERVIRYCQNKEAAESELLSELLPTNRSSLSGTIRIGAFSSVARSKLLPGLAKLLLAHPKIQMNLVVREVYELLPLLRSGEIEFLLSTSSYQRPGLTSVQVGSEKNVLVQKRNYRGPDLYLDHDEEDSTTAEYLSQFGGKRHGAVQRHYLDEIYAIIDGVKLGLGRAVLPEHLILNENTIEVVHPSKKLIVPIYMSYYEPIFQTQFFRSVLEQIKSCFVT